MLSSDLMFHRDYHVRRELVIQARGENELVTQARKGRWLYIV